MARKLDVKQHSISRLEQRSDMLLSTLRDYIGKMGDELVLIALFPGRAPIRIKGLADISGIGEVCPLRSPARAVAARAHLPQWADKVRATKAARRSSRKRNASSV